MMGAYNVLDKSGYTSTIYDLPGEPPRVFEREAYERFSANNPPSSILKYYGIHHDIPAGIILELAENNNLHKYRWDQKQFGHPDPDTTVFYRWAGQAAEALEFAHSVGVYNSDIHCVNFFLDHNLNLKVGDWAGASIDGSQSWSSYRLTHSLYDANGKDIPRKMGISATTEIFALGTALYEMVTGQDLWPDLQDPEDKPDIKKRISGKDFPDTSVLPVLGDIISKCWNLRFTTMTEVKLAIEAERNSSISDPSNNGILPMPNGSPSADQA